MRFNHFRVQIAVITLACLACVRGQGTGRGGNSFFDADDLNLPDFSDRGAGTGRGTDLTAFFSSLSQRLGSDTPRAATPPPTISAPAPGETTLTVAHINGISKQFADMFAFDVSINSMLVEQVALVTCRPVVLGEAGSLSHP